MMASNDDSVTKYTNSNALFGYFFCRDVLGDFFSLSILTNEVPLVTPSSVIGPWMVVQTLYTAN